MPQVPKRPEGWRFAGAAGDFVVWHAGKNDYRISDGATGPVVGTRDLLGPAHSFARREHELRRSAAITAYYSDRANSGQAALAT